MGVYKRKGAKYFTMDFVVNGQRIFETTNETGVKAAREEMERRRLALKNGTERKSDGRLRPVLLNTAAEKWLESQWDDWAVKTRKVEKNALNHLLPELGKLLLIDITPEDIRAYQRKRGSEGASPRSINIEVGTLRKIMLHNAAWERIKSSQLWQKRGMLDESTDKGRALTKEQQMILLLACRESASRYLMPFVVLLLETGARYNTIRTLTWKQVDFENRILTIAKDKTKAGTGRIVPLSKRAYKTLLRWAAKFPERRSTHYIFCSESYAMSNELGEVRVCESIPEKPIGTIKTAWQSAKKRTCWHCPTCKRGKVAKDGAGYRCQLAWCGAQFREQPDGVPWVRAHDCRHTAVTRMLKNKTALSTVGKVVGWAPSTMAAMSARYNHPEIPELRAAVEAISA